MKRFTVANRYGNYLHRNIKHTAEICIWVKKKVVEWGIFTCHGSCLVYCYYLYDYYYYSSF